MKIRLEDLPYGVRNKHIEYLSKKYPNKIEINSPDYGTFFTRPFAIINFNLYNIDDDTEIYRKSKEQITRADKEKKKFEYYNIFKLEDGEYPVFILYIPTHLDNQNWKKNNIGCVYLNNNPRCVSLPMSLKNDEFGELTKKWAKKFPLTILI